MSDNRALAQLSEIDVNRVILVTWIIRASPGPSRHARGGRAERVRPELRVPALPPRVRGRGARGHRSAYGALAGGLVLGMATELSTGEGFAGGVEPVYKPVVAFVVVIGALMLRPQGLFGKARTV